MPAPYIFPKKILSFVLPPNGIRSEPFLFRHINFLIPSNSNSFMHRIISRNYYVVKHEYLKSTSLPGAAYLNLCCRGISWSAFSPRILLLDDGWGDIWLRPSLPSVRVFAWSQHTLTQQKKNEHLVPFTDASKICIFNILQSPFLNLFLAMIGVSILKHLKPRPP